jgi:hypothetical protein
MGSAHDKDQMMKKKSVTLIFAAVLMCGANLARAVEGTVLWNNPKCGVNVIATDGGFTFNQQVSAGELSAGDTLEGALSVPEKTTSFSNLTTGKKLMMWVARYSTSKKIVLDRVPPSCRTDELAKLN